jgi:CheY-like chemotaxis protein
MSVDEARAREAGCDDFDTKPVDLPRLLGKMERLLSGHG